MKDINWQLTGSGKSHANSSMKSVGIGIGDKLVSLHQLGKELLKCTNENHKSLMEGLSALELLAPVNVPAPPQPEMSGFPSVRMYEQNLGPQYGLPSAPSHAAPVVPVEVPQQPRFDVPAAFTQGRKPPGYAKRAWKVVVQGGQGQARVRAVSPHAIRAEETPPAGWVQEFGLGSLVVGSYRHRILPDSFIEGAEPYPNL